MVAADGEEIGLGRAVGRYQSNPDSALASQEHPDRFRETVEIVLRSAGFPTSLFSLLKMHSPFPGLADTLHHAP
jgi:hypothetical protein